MVGFDGSRGSRAALGQALLLAQTVGARLHLFQAIEPVGPAGEFVGEESADPLAVVDEMESRLAEDPLPLLDEGDELAVALKLCEDRHVVCSSERLHGVARRLLRERSVGMDMLVIGRHGTTGRSRVGATAGNIVAQPSVPTALSRPELVPWDRLLLCFEPSVPGGRALQLAGRLASTLNITLDVVCADQRRENARKSLQYARRMLRAYHVEGEDLPYAGRMSDAVETAALELGSGAVFIPVSPPWPWSWSRNMTVEAAIDLTSAVPVVVP